MKRRITVGKAVRNYVYIVPIPQIFGHMIFGRAANKWNRRGLNADGRHPILAGVCANVAGASLTLAGRRVTVAGTSTNVVGVCAYVAGASINPAGRGVNLAGRGVNVAEGSICVVAGHLSLKGTDPIAAGEIRRG